MLVRSPGEILATLDADGTLDGLPFMPEMLDWCGKPFRVERRVEKTCVAPSYPMRRFAANDVVFLEGPRCDGLGHDGCKRACKIFWKEDWLRPVDSADASTQTSTRGLDELRFRLKTKSDQKHYFCQSTQLFKATEGFPGRKKPWRVRIVLREIRNGDRSVPEIVRLFVLWFWQHAMVAKRWLRGPHKQTPTASLGLKPGDAVRIKSRDQIVATLDYKRRNKGMSICYEMTRYCGEHAEVRDRLDRMIDEKTGRMREVRDTVLLHNVRPRRMMLRGRECLCEDKLGDCPRGELMYWREIWLERANGGGT